MVQYNNCPNCFAFMSEGSVCKNCGHDYQRDKQYAGVLPPFTQLNNRYVIGRVLGKGGFGVTYIAKDTIANSICAIKEYMPSEYSMRNGGTTNIVPFPDDKSKSVYHHGKEKFMEEAKTLLKLRNNPTVVDILDYFTQNNTAYLVMEYLDGQDLRKMSRANGGTIDVEFAKVVLVTVASSLMEVHRKNILHRDLSPENIFVTVTGTIKLIDFGAARNYVSTQNKGMSILLKQGFAPPEQYEKKGAQGPWSDVYALCATFYTLVSGKRLVDAMFRCRGEKQPSLAELGCPVTKKTSDVIMRGMELDYKRRYKDFKELLDDIDIKLSTPPSGKSNQVKVIEKVPQKPADTPEMDPVLRKTTVKEVPKIENESSRKGKRKFFRTEVEDILAREKKFVQSKEKRPVQLISKNETPVKATDYSVKPKEPPKQKPYVARIVNNKLTSKVVISGKDVFKIGRSVQSCQFVFSDDKNVSRIHCYVRCDGKNYFLCDASSNGTFFENGVRLVKNKEYVIAPGTKFYLATKNNMLMFSV